MEAGAALGLLGCGRGFCRSGVGAAQGFQLFGVLNNVAEQGVELVIAVELAQQIAQLLAGFEQTGQARHLLDDCFGVEMFKLCEIEFDFQIAFTFESVGHLIVQAGGYLAHDFFEIVTIDFNETTVFHFG